MNLAQKAFGFLEIEMLYYMGGIDHVEGLVWRRYSLASISPSDPFLAGGSSEFQTLFTSQSRSLQEGQY